MITTILFTWCLLYCKFDVDLSSVGSVNELLISPGESLTCH